jgi:hypothetical protein
MTHPHPSKALGLLYLHGNPWTIKGKQMIEVIMAVIDGIGGEEL